MAFLKHTATKSVDTFLKSLQPLLNSSLKLSQAEQGDAFVSLLGLLTKIKHEHVFDSQKIHYLMTFELFVGNRILRGKGRGSQ